MYMLEQLLFRRRSCLSASAITSGSLCHMKFTTHHHDDIVFNQLFPCRCCLSASNSTLGSLCHIQFTIHWHVHSVFKLLVYCRCCRSASTSTSGSSCGCTQARRRLRTPRQSWPMSTSHKAVTPSTCNTWDAR